MPAGPNIFSAARMRFAYYLIAAVFIAQAAFFSGCSSPGNVGNNSSTTYINNNSNAAPPSNLGNTASNSTTNCSSITSMPNPNGRFDPAVLRAALKTRLLCDSGGSLQSDDWQNDSWLEKQVGGFYKNDEDVLRAVICDITDKTLKPYNQKMKAYAKQRLYNSVTGTARCRTVLDLMTTATLSTTAVHPVP